MLMFICYFFPSIVATMVTVKIRKEKISYFDLVFYYAIYCILINLVITFVFSFIMGSKDVFLSENMFTHIFTFKYLLLSLVLSFVLPLLNEFILKNIKVNIEITKKDENEAKRNKKKKHSK